MKIRNRKYVLMHHRALFLSLILYVLPLEVSYLIFFYLVPPTKIQMMNHMSGSRIDMKENTEVEITCKVSNAKPRAGIIWFRNDVAFNPGIGQFSSIFQCKNSNY